MRRGTRQPGRHGFTIVEMPFDKLRVVRHMPRRVVSNCKGEAFTIVELLVVIALVGMLASILGVALVSARRTSIRLECQSKLSQIGQIIQQLSLDNGGLYPLLEQTPDSEGRYPALTPPIQWPQPNDPMTAIPVPWWARVHQQTQGAAIDAEPTAPGIQPAEQLPATMQMFHCRMAPALDNSGADGATRLQHLNETLSYGMNFDMKRVDGTPYQCVSGSNALAIGPRAGQADDKNPDQFTYTKIPQPGEFILVSEGNAGEFDANADDIKERCGYRIAAQKVFEAGDANSLHPARIIGRHLGEANVLFADQHVELRWATPPESGETETRDINLETHLWTLPAD